MRFAEHFCVADPAKVYNPSPIGSLWTSQVDLCSVPCSDPPDFSPALLALLCSIALPPLRLRLRSVSVTFLIFYSSLRYDVVNNEKKKGNCLGILFPLLIEHKYPRDTHNVLGILGSSRTMPSCRTIEATAAENEEERDSAKE